jgi:uncharacterized SAM-binding protein YcdF (DUF218 family)
LLVAFLAGFIAFAAWVQRPAPLEGLRADGIVVLTGGEDRVVEGARLLEEGRGRRLLVSGANRVASPEDIKRMSGLPSQRFKCCVDVGYAAHDTAGNAKETKAWAATWRFSTLIIVTSYYHMPRSLAELGRAMPEVALLPYPVGLRKTGRWWKSPKVARLVFTEYLKFLPSAARYSVARLMRWEGHAVAGGSKAPGIGT